MVLPFLTASAAIALSVVVVAALAGINVWFYVAHGLALPLATVIVMAVLAFTLNMVYGYFVESRTKRGLAALFGTYVPPELVDEMVKQPEKYTMQATSRELTVMFCDMRGFTAMSEQMDPVQLQQLLNDVFSRLTRIIRSHRGTIDKYMGDCVMAFWGAPVEIPNHAELAVRAALEMERAVDQINESHCARGLPEIGIGIGLNSGVMCVGDMGSDIRRSYTVIGDAVNLSSRLEGLSKHYGIGIVASESTKDLAPQFAWWHLDLVRAQGRAQAVAIFSPLHLEPNLGHGQSQMVDMAEWGQFMNAYRAQEWTRCVEYLSRFTINPSANALCELYAARIAELQQQPYKPNWDGATNFANK
jgi:adenylate cyclase